MKPNIYILTCREYPLGNASLQDLCDIINEQGEFEARFCIWQDFDINILDKDDIVLPLAIWDYSLAYGEFLAFLSNIKHHDRIFNNETILRQNSTKCYLRDIKNSGFSVIDSLFLENVEDYHKIYDFADKTKGKKLVIKPLVGQSGNSVRLLTNININDLQNEYKNGALVQVFEENITKGEFCLIFFDRQFSHAIHRKPALNQWKTNSQYGAQISPFHPNEIAKNMALEVVESYAKDALYARVDLIEISDSNFIINEVELIEPNLYFNIHKDSLYSFYDTLKSKL